MSADYEYLNESSIDVNLKCSICHRPFENPYITSCEHIFCFKCIEQQIQINKSCSICHYHILTIDNLIPVKTHFILNMLDGLLVKCKFCNEKGIERGHFEDHLNTCRKGKKCLCPAADIRCPWIGHAEELPLHIKQCPYERIRPVLTEILTESHRLKQKISQVLDFYETEMKKISFTKELQKENQQLKEQINQLHQKLENDIHYDRAESTSSQTNSLAPPINRSITFERLLVKEKFGIVPNGYAGLNWMNVRYTNEENTRVLRPKNRDDRLSIFLRGHSCVIYNDWKNPLIISSIQQQTFTFYACEIMSVNDLEKVSKLNITGRKDKLPIHSKMVLLKYNEPKIIEFESWNNIDEIEFSIRNNYFILTWIQLE